MNDDTIKLLEVKKPSVDFLPKEEELIDKYCLWKAMPSMLRYPPRSKDGTQPSARDFAKQMSIHEETMLELVEIKTQKEFGEKFAISENTLTRWNKDHVESKSAHELMKYWSSSLSKNVLLALYNKCIRTGFGLEVKLWFQLVEGWSEKTTLEIKPKVVDRIEYQIIESPHDNKKEDKQEASASAPILER